MLSQRLFKRGATETATTTIMMMTYKKTKGHCFFVFFLLVPTITVLISLWNTAMQNGIFLTTMMVDVDHRIIQTELLQTSGVQQTYESRSITSIVENSNNNNNSNSNTFESFNQNTTTDDDDNKNNNNGSIYVAIQPNLMFGQNIEFYTGYNGTDPDQWQQFGSDFFTGHLCSKKIRNFPRSLLQIGRAHV